METKFVFFYFTLILCSYRTYEEWKQVWKDGNQIRYIRSYRTYEEWKRG